MKLRLLFRHMLLGLGTAIACLPPIHAAENGTHAVSPEDAQKVEKFVREELRACGLKNVDSIPITPHDGYEYSIKKGMLVPYQELATLLAEREKARKIENINDRVEFIKDLLNNKALMTHYRNLDGTKPPTSELIKEENELLFQAARGSIRHEVGHWVNNHSQKRARFEKFTKIPIAVIVAGGLVMCGLGLLDYLGTNSTQIKQIALVGRCVGSLISTYVSVKAADLLNKAYARHQEWEADESIPDDPKMLRAQEEEYKRMHQNMVKYKDQNPNIDIVTDPKKNWWGTHPLHQKRADRFKERAEAAEKGLPRPPRKSFCAIS